MLCILQRRPAAKAQLHMGSKSTNVVPPKWHLPIARRRDQVWSATEVQFEI